MYVSMLLFAKIYKYSKSCENIAWTKMPPPPALCYVWLKLAESLWEIVKNQIVYLLLIKQFNSKGDLMPKWCSD